MRAKLGVLSAGVAAVVGLTAAPVAAAPAAESAACYGAACNGLDPVANGCTADSRLVHYGYTEADGVVELRHSTTCGTMYARVLFSYPGAELYIGGANAGTPGYYRVRVPEGSTSVVSPLLAGATLAYSGSAFAFNIGA
ncbi:DUF2690 domain-containing protein [Allostreptomyces psammosilenae]|uniref:DUF2690 domain-containing protein n=1 Tax=Allostreptomyces psammosilenae TaxID=1892865 RepID=A0A853A2E4_9ACTN|nr:DUF2690 domain-containing protein [Allostreptomyces psammosilenae]NYI04618.1 hypothetical protein [Allostreptomyces psammosilenae]